MNQYDIFKRVNTFKIFTQFVDYENETILDFGGNRGNLIHFSDGKILPEKYTSMDVSKNALNALLEEFPNANTIYWNRHHQTYNPQGNKNEQFPGFNGFLGALSINSLSYDMSFANSVFTHMDLKEILFCIRGLQIISNEINFTYIDPENTRIFEVLRKRHNAIDLTDEEIANLSDHDISYILNRNKVVNQVREPYNDIWTVIKTDFLKEAIINSSAFAISIESGMTTGFNWMKIKVRDRLPANVGIIGY